MSNNKNTSVTITEQDELNKMLVYTAVTYDRIRYIIQLTPHIGAFQWPNTSNILLMYLAYNI